jgi:hypothetical protein
MLANIDFAERTFSNFFTHLVFAKYDFILEFVSHILINVNIMEKRFKKDYIDGNLERFFRKSAISRVIIGTTVCTGVSVLYAVAHAKYRKLDTSFIINWLKGSTVAGLSFFSLNELFFASSKYFKIYTNFWINYTFIAYYLAKVHYRYLIRNHRMPWYSAIKYSHKCFLYLCVGSMLIELIAYIIREVQLYDDEDIFDILSERFMKDGRASFNFGYDELCEHFLKSFHVVNSSDKVRDIKRYMREHPNESKINTIDLYEFYKGNNIK